MSRPRMFQLVTPPGMLFTTALLVIYCVYAFLTWYLEESWRLLAGGVLSVVAIFGVAMVRPWSRYLVYLLATGFISKLGLSVLEGITSGYFEMQFGSVSRGAKSLVPGFLMVVLSSLCCVIVYRQFRGVDD